MTKNKDLSWTPAAIMEKMSVARIVVYLETGFYPEGKFSKTWDLLAYCDYYNNLTK